MASFDRSHTGSYSPSIVWRCLVSFARYSDLLVENREIGNLYLAPPQGVIPSEFRAGKTRMSGLSYGEKTMTVC